MIPGIEEAFREGTSGEMNIALIGQRFVIGSLRDYKQWKVDNKINGSIMDKNVYKAYKNHAGAIQAKMIRKMEKDRLKDK